MQRACPRISRAVLLLTAFASACSVATAAPDAARRPNVVLLLSDDQRPDTIGALGNRVIRTPHLDRLVEQGTSFSRAVAANPICTPSRAEIMTGASGFRNGVLDFGRPIRPESALWAETLRRAGYHTWYVGKWHNDGSPTDRGYEETSGLYQGGGGSWAVRTFDWNGRPVTGYTGWVFHSPDKDPRTGRSRLLLEQGVGLTPNISELFADSAIELIRRQPDKPFFLHVNFTAPHDPLLMPFGCEQMYDPARIPLPANFLPEHPFDHGNLKGRDELLFEWPRTPKAVRDELSVYYAVISHLDAQVGRIVEALRATGQLENTLLIYSSDHGLAVGSHGLRGKQSMYEHTVNVPLVIRSPGVPAGRRCDAQCYLRDLFPTACDFAGIDIPASVEGRSLRPVLTGEASSVYPFVVAYFRNFQRMIRTDDWKLIHYPHLDRYQLFDMRKDRDELNDLIADPRQAHVVADLRAKLREWQQQHDDPVLKTGTGP